MRIRLIKKSFLIIVLFGLISCAKTPEGEPYIPPLEDYITENVIVVIMDGARYSETWGDPTLAHIPNMGINLADESVVISKFYNNGVTSTVPGHTAITTAYYQNITNDGNQLPDNPSIFQYWTDQTGMDSTKAWVITSKDKLQVLANCEDENFKEKYMPSNNCGVDGKGVGSGYRSDSLTFNVVKSVIDEHHPNLMLINFKQPDAFGHTGNWENYLAGIESVDNYVYELWNIIQADEIYKDKTTLIVTNDHGRHLDGVSSGFKGHGDDCEGCRHIMFFGIGPDFKAGEILNTHTEQVDIPKTIAALLEFHFLYGEGRVMTELFVPKIVE